MPGPVKINPKNHKFLQKLTEIPVPVDRLFYLGTLPNSAPTVAIVGSRKPTTYGREITRKLACELAKRGVTIVSGLALGHDALAHRGALDGGGLTVAVLGNGLPTIYPSTNKNLADDIIKNHGAIISEFDLGYPPLPPNFLQRNRIVSGLADVIVVVEAARHSGTLNTAAHALAQGKEVMAVPGNITSPTSEGCNLLIKQGASPCLSYLDVLEKLGLSEVIQTKNLSFKDPAQQTIYDLIKQGIRDGEELLKVSKLNPIEFQMAITMLELNDYILPLGANNWGLK